MVTCFASHIHRVQQVADAAIAGGRSVATLGRSMQKNVALARRLGLLDIPDGALIDVEDIDNLEDGQVCVISTGSQGEPMSALSRLAIGENRFFCGSARRGGDQRPSDPGQRVVGGAGHRQPVYKHGVEVIHSGVDAVHVSGHARQGELAMLMSVVQGDLRPGACKYDGVGQPHPPGCTSTCACTATAPCCARTATPS